ncbi:Pre-mRNA-splicing factor SPF27 [Lophiotrema nucula]|uniref:Pre-mRNA-splicing factor SPF27 n=1 Tax=Lophiotrema nucula TaxID=690887 RepID=A0A6A5ZIS8_9PLEO|nr:Pre-mRNA-splicing factor SPF27 [Lophiotrema nucula]
MPLIDESYDSLPYVDAPPSEASLAAARALIAADIKGAGIDPTQLHPALIPAASYEPKYSGAIEREHARLQENPSSKLSAIDLKRYEELEAPPTTNPTSDEDRPEVLEQWNQALKKAYASSEYVNGRLTELGLLEKFGKNAWLIGNSQLEDILKAIETELADVKKQQEDIEVLRRSQQESVGGEITTLEDTWKKGISRLLETEVAAEGLKQQILERRRAGAA